MDLLAFGVDVQCEAFALGARFHEDLTADARDPILLHLGQVRDDPEFSSLAAFHGQVGDDRIGTHISGGISAQADSDIAQRLSCIDQFIYRDQRGAFAAQLLTADIQLRDIAAQMNDGPGVGFVRVGQTGFDGQAIPLLFCILGKDGQLYLLAFAGLDQQRFALRASLDKIDGQIRIGMIDGHVICARLVADVGHGQHQILIIIPFDLVAAFHFDVQISVITFFACRDLNWFFHGRFDLHPRFGSVNAARPDCGRNAQKTGDQTDEKLLHPFTHFLFPF